MQNIKIIKEIAKSNSFVYKSICDRFDIDINQFSKKIELSFDFPIEWKIGLITGLSGTGKSLIAKELFPNNYNRKSLINPKIPLVDNFQEHNLEDIISSFLSVGLGSVPEWLNSYENLSTGQKMRAKIVEVLLSNDKLIVYDEFTSVVDREVAKCVSHSIFKAFKKSDKQFVAISCHRDIEDWLEPDWILDMNTQELMIGKKKDQTFQSQYFQPTKKFGSFSKTIII